MKVEITRLTENESRTLHEVERLIAYWTQKNECQELIAQLHDLKSTVMGK